jgi:PAS domain S-box-containing protein
MICSENPGDTTENPAIAPASGLARTARSRATKTKIRASAGEDTEISDMHFVNIVAVCADAIVVVDKRNVIRFVNPSAVSLFSYGSEADLSGRTLDILIPERFRASHAEHMRDFGRSEEQGRFMAARNTPLLGRRADGSEFFIEVSISKSAIGSETFFVAIIRDKSIEKKQEERLSMEILRTASANAAKSQFLANMSHELRTPLNAIIGFSDFLRMQPYGPLGCDKYMQYIEDIRGSGEHLLQIVNDLLDMSKIEAGESQLNETDCDLGEIVEAVVRMVGRRAGAAGIEVITDIAACVPRLRADEKMLRQILINLMSNAVKFTPAGGRVSLSAYTEGRGLVLSVADTGVGIAPEMMDVVMRPFGQANNSLKRGIEGTGLGLPLVKGLAELHGGSFELHSVTGEGTTALVRLPAERVLSGQ